MTSRLSDAKLARARAKVNTTLPGTAIIKSVSFVGDSEGATRKVGTPKTGGTVSCRKDPLQSKTQIEKVGQAAGVKEEYMITLPYNAPAAIGDWLTIDGEDWELRQFANKHDWNVSKRFQIERVE